VSSPYVRCVQTLEPLAAERGLTVEVADELAEGGEPVAALVLMLALAAEGPAAVCTHGDVMQLTIFELADSGIPLTGGSPLDVAKSSTWVLDVLDGTTCRARYEPPSD
jgi:phosphohistidine phosphatase SixA